MLNLYVLKRSLFDRGPEFNVTHGFLIAATCEDQAREFAVLYWHYPGLDMDNRHRDESPDIWYSPETACTQIGVAGQGVSPGVILEDPQMG